jgi:hypothetical protein
MKLLIKIKDLLRRWNAKREAKNLPPGPVLRWEDATVSYWDEAEQMYLSKKLIHLCKGDHVVQIHGPIEPNPEAKALLDEVFDRR